MTSKNRLFIVAAIILLMGVAMLASFGRSLFATNTPHVVLPSSSVETGDASGSSSPEPGYQRVDVTTQTVTSVVATLARPASYYRELTVETFWTEGSSTSQVQVWADNGWSHSRQALPSGVVRHDLTGEDRLYYWYDGSSRYEQAPADEKSSDLAQHIPTYETVLELGPEDITAAGYELRGELPCVYVEVRSAGSQRLQRYWVGVDSGLLVSAETEEDGQLVYRMTAYAPVQSPCPGDGRFELPDGTVLHKVGE